MARLVIFGAGDIARLAHFYFKTDSPHDVHAFVVDAAYKQGDTFDGLPLCAFEDLPGRYPPSEFDAFVAISYAQMNRVRRAKYDAMVRAGYRCVTYVSSRCTYLSTTPPGANCFILEDNTIQPFVTIGNNVTLWSGNHVGHDSVIEDDCFVSSQVVISGRVRVGAGSFLGVNATLRNAITIGTETLVAAGAVIMTNTAPQGVYIPERARRFPKPSDEMDL
jgi:sugar O-acyltransferase (sialic acid O-acetyltransferase NeuD family)